MMLFGSHRASNAVNMKVGTMGKRVVEILVDDLTGEESDKVETITFSLDNISYELELNPKNADKFRGLFQSYIAVARKTGGRARRGSGGAKASNREELQAMREWARANGHEVSDRGRISQEIRDAYSAANK